MSSENYTHVAKENSWEVNIRVVYAALVLFRSCLILRHAWSLGFIPFYNSFVDVNAKKPPNKTYGDQVNFSSANASLLMSRIYVKENESVVFNLCFQGENISKQQEQTKPSGI